MFKSTTHLQANLKSLQVFFFGNIHSSPLIERLNTQRYTIACWIIKGTVAGLCLLSLCEGLCCNSQADPVQTLKIIIKLICKPRSGRTNNQPTNQLLNRACSLLSVIPAIWGAINWSLSSGPIRPTDKRLLSLVIYFFICRTTVCSQKRKMIFKCNLSVEWYCYLLAYFSFIFKTRERKLKMVHDCYGR